MKKGDKVRVLDAEKRTRYEQITNKIGEIVRISSYIDPSTHIENTNYYVEIPEYANEYQSKGWWVFKNANSLRLISDEVTCDDQRDEYEYAIRSMWGIDSPPFNREYTIKGENKDMAIKKGDNYMTILEIYKERRREKINKKYNDMENAI